MRKVGESGFAIIHVLIITHESVDGQRRSKKVWLSRLETGRVVCGSSFAS